jgi:hypothetical protein
VLRRRAACPAGWAQPRCSLRSSGRRCPEQQQQQQQQQQAERLLDLLMDGLRHGATARA